MWLKDLSFNGSMCLIFVAFVFIFSWYISMIENCLCKKMLLYSSTFVLCVQIIVVVASIVECIFVYLQNIVIKFLEVLLVIGFLFCMIISIMCINNFDFTNGDFKTLSTTRK